MRKRAPPDIERMLFVSGGELAALRRAQGLSRPDLAEAAGVHRNTVANIERGSGRTHPFLAMSLMQIHLRASGVLVEGEGFVPVPHPDDGTNSIPIPISSCRRPAASGSRHGRLASARGASREG